MHNNSFFVALFLIFAVTATHFQVAPAAAQVQQDLDISSLEGSYRVMGHNPDGSSYSGSLSVRVTDGVANFRWSVAGDVFKGKGSLIGNVVVVDWGQKSPVIYTVDLDGNLAGTWDGGNASERATRQ